MTAFDLVKKILNDIFMVSVASWAIFCLAELSKPGLVTNYFNLSWFLLWCVLIGIIQLIASPSIRGAGQKARKLES